EWQIPKSLTDVRAFLGLTGYYRRFVDRFAAISAPLSELLKDDEFKWTKAAQAAFIELKKALTSTPVLVTFDPAAPKKVETDASGYAIGGVLYQADGSGQWHPLAYYSKKLTAAERNYTVTEQELLGLVRCLRTWEHWLNQDVVVETDHKALEYLFTQADISGRRARWIETLIKYDALIKYRLGVQNAAADALSRASWLQPSATDTATLDNDMEPAAPAMPVSADDVSAGDDDVFFDAQEEQTPEMDDLSESFEKLSLMTINSDQNTDDDELKVVILHPQATLPVSAHEEDAGYDVATPNTMILHPGMTTKGCSSLAMRGVHPIGGVVDRGYTGEISVLLRNASKKTVKLSAGEKAAQLVVVKIAKPHTVRVRELRATARGTGGFGSSGKMIADISSWTVSLGAASDSYKGDRMLERIFAMLSSKQPVAPSATTSLQKFHIRNDILYKNSRRCVGS
ncbi:DNA/RNA polymerase, partial [Coemansia reversa NRRL 1564]